MMEELNHDQEQVVYGDRAYADARKQANFEELGEGLRANHKSNSRLKLNIADRSFNQKNNRTRGMSDGAFYIVKYLCGFTKVRCRGIEMNEAKVLIRVALADL